MPALPECSLFTEPLLDGRQFLGLQLASPDAADLVRTNQTRLFEHADVLHERRQRHVERHGEVAHSCFPQAKPLNDGSACGVSERVKRAVECELIVFHLANYTTLNS